VNIIVKVLLGLFGAGAAGAAGYGAKKIYDEKKENEELISERDRYKEKYTKSETEKNNLVSERDKYKNESDELKIENDALKKTIDENQKIKDKYNKNEEYDRYNKMIEKEIDKNPLDIPDEELLSDE